VTSNSRRQQGHLIKYDLAKLKDIEVKKVFQNRIETRCQNRELMKELANDNWTTNKAIIRELTEKTVKEERSKR
jgi:hypothetical protein